MNLTLKLIGSPGGSNWLVWIPGSVLFIWIYYRYLVKKYSRYLKVTGKSLGKVIFSKGDQGEFRVFRVLDKMDQPGEILLNLYLPQGNGDTTEVDAVYLTGYGVFVIESKNYKGWIHGGESQQYWTQTFKNGHKEKFYNPIRQNRGHLRALQQITELPQDALRSLVVFGDGATLKNIHVTSEISPVINLRKLARHMTSERNRSPVLLKPEEIQDLKKKLDRYCQADEKIMVQHMTRIRQKYNTARSAKHEPK